MAKSKVKFPSTKTITVKVAEGHIKKGEQLSRHNCPVARAVQAKLNKSSRVYVASNQLVFNNFPTRKPSHTVLLPKEVTKFINQLDNNSTNPPSPITFTMTVPTKYLK